MKKGIMFAIILLATSLCFANVKIFGSQLKGNLGVITFITMSDGELAEQTSQTIPTTIREGSSTLCNVASAEGKTSAVLIWTTLMQNISEGKMKIKNGSDLSGGTATEEVEIIVSTVDGNTGTNTVRKITDFTEATVFAAEFFGE